MPLETRLLHGTASSAGARGGPRIGLGSCLICAGPIGFEWLLPRTKKMHAAFGDAVLLQLAAPLHQQHGHTGSVWTFGETGAPLGRSQEISASDVWLKTTGLSRRCSRGRSSGFLSPAFSSFRHLTTPDIRRRPRSIHHHLAGRCLCFFAEGVSALFVVFVFSQTLSGLALARHPLSSSSSRPIPYMIDRRFG